jgi:hypothetical protein
MSVLVWPGKGPNQAKRFRAPPLSTAYAATQGLTINIAAAVPQALGGLPAIAKLYQIPFPVVDPSIVNFSFTTSTPEGSWSFLFKWYAAMASWNCWVTMPDGTIRATGCIPLVLNWMGYADFSVVFLGDQAAFGQSDLVGSSMLLIVWA